MLLQTTQDILPLFKIHSPIAKQFLTTLINQAVTTIGLEQCLSISKQWLILSQKLSNPSKLTCLSDLNHRSMIIQFMKFQAVEYYQGSYFNRAKIDDDYLKYLKSMGPYVFAEVITIVSKLNLICRYKNKQQHKQHSENHIDIKIQRIVELCNSQQKNIRNNLNKFRCIVEEENDREELTKELGKLLRIAWAKEKKKNKRGDNQQSQASFDNQNSINGNVGQLWVKYQQPSELSRLYKDVENSNSYDLFYCDE